MNHPSPDQRDICRGRGWVTCRADSRPKGTLGMGAWIALDRPHTDTPGIQADRTRKHALSFIAQPT
jgi:hypothetical protein